jgi:hypothetical protein
VLLLLLLLLALALQSAWGAGALDECWYSSSCLLLESSGCEVYTRLMQGQWQAAEAATVWRAHDVLRFAVV